MSEIPWPPEVLSHFVVGDAAPAGIADAPVAYAHKRN